MLNVLKYGGKSNRALKVGQIVSSQNMIFRLQIFEKFQESTVDG